LGIADEVIPVSCAFFFLFSFIFLLFLLHLQVRKNHPKFDFFFFSLLFLLFLLPTFLSLTRETSSLTRSAEASVVWLFFCLFFSLFFGAVQGRVFLGRSGFFF